MDVFNGNLEKLLAIQEGFERKKIEDFFQKYKDLPSVVQLAEARDGSRIFLYQKEGKEYRLNSSYRPQAEADRWASQYSCTGISQCFVFYGLGNGMFLSSLLKNCREDARILVYEPRPEIFAQAFLTMDLCGILSDPRVSLHAEEAGGLPCYRLLDQYVTKENEKMLTLCVHPQYDVLFPEGIQMLQKEIQDLKGRLRAAENTRKAYGRRIVKNTCYAWKRYVADKKAGILSKDLSELPQEKEMAGLQMAVSKGMPAVILSTGPSLAKSAELLGRLKGKAVLFAVDSSARYLLAKGVEPDYLVTIDPLKWPKHFHSERCRSIPVFCRFDSNFRLLEGQKGALIFFGGTEYSRLLSGEDALFINDTGGSVATAAFSLCQALGFSKIILVGQDLCYDGDKTHAGGIISPDEKKQGFGKTWVPGNLSEKVQTRQDWYRYLKWFENEIILHPECRVVNATAGGAKIQGTEWKNLEDIIIGMEEEESAWKGESPWEEERAWKEPGEMTADAIPMEMGKPKNPSNITCMTGKKEAAVQYLRQEPEILNQLTSLLANAQRDCETLKNACRLSQLTIVQWKEYLSSSEESGRVSGLIAQLEELPVYYLLDLLLPEETTSGIYQLTGDPMEDEYQTWCQMEGFFAALKEALEVLKEIQAEVMEMMEHADFECF